VCDVAGRGWSALGEAEIAEDAGLSSFSVCGTSYASSAASPTTPTPARIRCRRRFASTRAARAPLRRGVAIVEAIYGVVV
jgi:hypothetical protein